MTPATGSAPPTPPTAADTVPDAVFVALADPTRRQLLEVLGRRPPTSASTLAEELPVSRQAILKHLTLLAGCGLVASHREGRTVLFEVRSQPLTDAAAWMTSVATSWDSRLSDLKRRAEQA